jgi:hypothetical protein
MEDCTRMDIINASNFERKNLTKKLSKTRVTKSDVWKHELKGALSDNWKESSNGLHLTLGTDEAKTKILINKDDRTNLYGYSISCNTSVSGKGFSSVDLTKTLLSARNSIDNIIKSLKNVGLACTHEINLLNSKSTHTNQGVEEYVTTDTISREDTAS